MSQSKNSLVHLNKAKMYFNYTICLFLSLYILTNFLLDKVDISGILQAGVAAFNIFVLLLFIILGASQIVKSFTSKEPFHPHRIFYLGGYLISLIVVFVLAQESYYKVYYLLN
ncbi:MAG: hypothetical protein ABIN95_12110 [Mucilaginibacter sp.]